MIKVKKYVLHPDNGWVEVYVEEKKKITEIYQETRTIMNNQTVPSPALDSDALYKVEVAIIWNRADMPEYQWITLDEDDFLNIEFGISNGDIYEAVEDYFNALPTPLGVAVIQIVDLFEENIQPQEDYQENESD